jgi:hypothetical protein
MIAPLRLPETRPPAGNEALRRARRLVADMFLVDGARTVVPKVSAWRAWLVAAWMAAVLIAFVIVLLGGSR